MLNKKTLIITALTALMVIVGYTGLIYGIGDKCLSIEMIGCMKIGDKCLMVCNVILDHTYRSNGDIPIMVVKERGTQTIITVVEMNFVGTVGECDEYEGRPEIPCNEPYDVYVYINDISGLPIVAESPIVCP
jgi:hypothetical protein